MARTGKKPIIVPKGIQVSFLNNQQNHLYFKGDKGNLNLKIPEGLRVFHRNDKLFVDCDESIQKLRQKRGTLRQLINNCVIGVSQLFTKTLLLEGVGYRVQEENANSNCLILYLGFSYPIQYNLPEAVTAKIENNNTKIVLNSPDKHLLGQVASEIRFLRPPEPYKGKGIRYEHEVLLRKAGKSGKK